ncbi:hypothetical protein PROFUN_00775 [Planoprotostelium fungivorum]|uniref:RING-type domain-containing protein n=1 Tax=Planoprotostelium fungivorum TaxID=1890364 RepID=A0A2P6NZX4_9EUKA|nr:hypothetical protein PROFUN_00775 [Planoprotostelium fungivorum]
MGSNQSRRSNRRQREDDYRTIPIIRRDEHEHPLASTQSDEMIELPSRTPSIIPEPMVSEVETLPELISSEEEPSAPSPQPDIGVAIASNEVSRADGSQPSIRLSIIYYIPHRRGRDEGPNIEDALNGDQPFSGDMLGRVLFAMTIPLNANNGNSLFGLSSFEDLLDHLMRQHQPQGPPPTSKNVLDRLPIVTAEAKHTCETCLVCQENFVEEESVLELPCKHNFHKDCVTTWLEQHCTCPTCRYELPVDDKEYEVERKKRMAGRGIDEEVLNGEEREEMEVEEENSREEKRRKIQELNRGDAVEMTAAEAAE